MTTLTPEYFVTRWSDPKSRLIKESLIDETGCCCAQGDVLRCAGYSDQQLREITQENADREVARLLGISLAESALLRLYSCGQPQDVFQAPEKVLGPHHRLWTAFGRHIDQMSKEDWDRVVAAWAAAGTEAGYASWEEARIAARASAREEARIAARDASWAAAVAAEVAAAAREAAGAEVGAAARAAASHASDEIVGWSRLEEPFFLKMFFDDPRAWVESIEEADGGAA